MYLNDFNVFLIILYFSIYSFLGWIIEVLYAYWNQGFFVNRGFLYGPFCPIYGSGITLVVFLLDKFKTNILILFILATILTSLLEYLSGFILENFFHTKWWDYSNNFCNLNGRVCLFFSLIWGLSSIAIINLVHPFIYSLVNLIPYNFIKIFATLLFAYFISDLTFTIISLIQFNGIISQLANIKEEILSKVNNLKSSTLEIATNANETLEEQIKSLRDKYDNITLNIKSNHVRLIRSFPYISSKSYNNTLLDLKEKLKNLRNKK